MIESITIKNLRGIREGTLERLTPLVVLVGPNSSGKSTVLDGLLIGAGLSPAKSAGYAVQRRVGLRHGARWLLWRGAEGPATLEVRFTGDERRISQVHWSEGVSGPLEETLRRRLMEQAEDGPYSTVEVEVASSSGSGGAACVVAASNAYLAEECDSHLVQPSEHVWMVDPRHGFPLHDLYSRISERGRRQAILELLSAVVPGLQVMEILTEHENPRLHLTFDDHSVPVALAGDGVQMLVRLTLELAGRASGTRLLEEPEAHQHPAAIRASARAIVEGVRSGIQVIITTHSLELIDALLGALRDEELPLLSLYRLRLDRGLLRTSMLTGAEVLQSRGEIEDDLR